ncbi:hypothetical protein QUF80_09830 [Desulfococcaceae bacterium HSG8]|nr:hypothetical protein [Desulfococcaceae bacterium HSG8]
MTNEGCQASTFHLLTVGYTSLHPPYSFMVVSCIAGHEADVNGRQFSSQL